MYEDTKALEKKRREYQRKYQSNLITKKEFASEIRTSTCTIDRMRKKGNIASKVIGGRILFSIDELVRIVEA